MAPSAVVSVIVDAARLWPTPKRLAISQALTPVGTDEISTRAAVQSLASPTIWLAVQTQAGNSRSLKAEVTLAMPALPEIPYFSSAMPSEIKATGPATPAI